MSKITHVCDVFLESCEVLRRSHRSLATAAKPWEFLGKSQPLRQVPRRFLQIRKACNIYVASYRKCEKSTTFSSLLTETSESFQHPPHKLVKILQPCGVISSLVENCVRLRCFLRKFRRFTRFSSELVENYETLGFFGNSQPLRHVPRRFLQIRKVCNIFSRRLSKIRKIRDIFLATY